MQKHSIVVDVRMINSSGIGTYLKNLLPIVGSTFNLTLLGKIEELKEFAWTENCQIIPFEAKIYSVKEQLLFPKIVPKTKLLWSPHFNTPLFQVRAENIVSTIHDVNHLAFNKSRLNIKQHYAKKLIGNTIAKSIKIITVSQFSKDEILKFTKTKKENIKVIYNGVDQNFFNSLPNFNREKLPEFYFLFVGNVKPHKNLITLLKAYLILPDEIKSRYKIVVLGKKDGFITPDKEIYHFIREHSLTEAIHFTGHIPDDMVSWLYKKATLFIFPSNYEGFGLPLLESMASGTAVISSNIPSSTEIAGDAALYFDQNNSENLSEKIILLLSNEILRNEFIEKGKQQIKQYDWIKAATEHINLFKEILDQTNDA